MSRIRTRTYLKVESQVATLPPQAAQLALERAPQVLDLVPVVDRQEVSRHLRILNREEMFILARAFSIHHENGIYSSRNSTQPRSLT